VLKAAVCALALVFFCSFEPVDWLVCPFRRLTGLPCPLCGMTRALCAIGHGHFRSAVELNAVSPMVFALFLGGLVWSTGELGGWSPPRSGFSQAKVFAGLLSLLLVNWVWLLAHLMT
jgi:hypothetical protein